MIVQKNDRFGIIDERSGDFILPLGFDTIFALPFDKHISNSNQFISESPLFACKKNDSVITGNTVPELILTDVAYASISTQQKMDVYLPADRSTATTYAVVMIHGGSWSGGDKSDFNTNIPELRQLLGNYAVFNLHLTQSGHQSSVAHRIWK